MRFLVDMVNFGKRLTKKQLLGRVDIEETPEGPEIVIRLGFETLPTAQLVAAQLMGEEEWSSDDKC